MCTAEVVALKQCLNIDWYFEGVVMVDESVTK